jgi:hypothetical protein
MPTYCPFIDQTGRATISESAGGHLATNSGLMGSSRVENAALGFFKMSFRRTVDVDLVIMCICLTFHGAPATSTSLPPGVLKALAGDERNFCEQFLGDYKKGCHQTFRDNLLWLELEIAPSKQPAFLVENHNLGACGSAGCSLYLFIKKSDVRFVQVLGTDGEVGALGDVEVLKDITRGYYNILKTWHDGKRQTLYLWDGQRYSAR